MNVEMQRTGRLMGVGGIQGLRTARVAVVGLEVTTGQPPLIVQVAVYHVEGGSIVAGPRCFWVAPDAPLSQVPVSAWADFRLSPPWPEVAAQVVDAIGDRLLAVLDADRLCVLQEHLPDWQPAGVVLARELAEQTCPDLAVDDGRNGLAAGAGRGAVAEAHAVAMTLGWVLDNNRTGRASASP